MFTGEEQASEQENGCPTVSLGVDTDCAPDLEEDDLDSEAELMKSMGLPLHFGGHSAHRDFAVKITVLYFFCLLCVPERRGMPTP